MPAAFEPQVQQRKIDVVETAQTGFERMARALLLFEAHAHLTQVFLRAAALAVSAPIHLLQFVQELGGALGVAGHGARFHVGDAFPGFGVLGEVVFVGRLGLHQRSRAAVGAQPRIHG